MIKRNNNHNKKNNNHNKITYIASKPRETQHKGSSRQKDLGFSNYNIIPVSNSWVGTPWSYNGLAKT